MPSERDKAKRFQFSLGDLLWVTVAACGTAFMFSLSLRFEGFPGSVYLGLFWAVPIWSIVLILSGRVWIGLWLLAAWLTLVCFVIA